MFAHHCRLNFVVIWHVTNLKLLVTFLSSCESPENAELHKHGNKNSHFFLICLWKTGWNAPLTDTGDTVHLLTSRSPNLKLCCGIFEFCLVTQTKWKTVRGKPQSAGKTSRCPFIFYLKKHRVNMVCLLITLHLVDLKTDETFLQTIQIMFIWLR